MNTKAQKPNDGQKEVSITVKRLVESGQTEESAVAIESFLSGFGSLIEAVEVDKFIGNAHTVAHTALSDDEVKNDLDGTLDNDVRGEAASYLVERFFGQICRDLYIGMDYAAKSIERKQRQVAGALKRNEKNPGDTEAERSIATQIRWLTQFLVQQEIRAAMLDFAKAMYRAQVGLEWTEPDTSSVSGPKGIDNPAFAALLGE